MRPRDSRTASAVDELASHLRQGKVTFPYSSREQQYNNAVALKVYLENLSWFEENLADAVDR
jgi:uncharacterized protein YeaO (DUF488 family)